ncbi:MAG: hypothetical protein ABEJ26_01115 [Halosimplex sp.]
MEPWGDRGQSIQIGAVLIFAALILLLSLYQATVVPQQNRQIEFDHSQQVQGELLDLRNAVVSMMGDSARRSVSIQLGTTYPSRVLAVNPPPVSGQLRTVGTADGTVSLGLANATALDDETDDFWTGTRRDYVTGGVVYRPSYHEYGQPPSTVYENSVLYDDFSFEGATIARSDQVLVDGSTITLVTLNGSLRRSSSGTTSVDVRPVSASPTTVAVTNSDPDSNVTLRVPTRLSESTWADLLEDELVEAGGNVTDLRTNPIAGHPDYRMLVVELVPGTYELRMAKAGVGTRVTDTSAAYVTEISGNGSSVPEGSTGQFVVEVRDRYNNPVSGVTVEAATDGVGSVTAARETGDDGRAVFTFRAPANVDGASVEGRVNASFTVTPGSGLTSFAGGTPVNVSMNVTVRNSDGSGLGGVGGGGAGYSLQWTSPTTVPGTTSGGEACTSTPDPCNLTMRAETAQSQIGAPVGFGSDDTSVARVFDRTTATGSDGTAETTVRFGRTEDNATLWTQSAGTNDTRLIATPSYESFETDLGKYGVFGTFQGSDSDKLTSQNANTGSQSALIDGGNDGGIVTTEYNTTGAEMVVVQYWARDSGAEENDADTGKDEDVVVEYKSAAGTWVQADLLEAKGSADSPQNPTYHRTVRLGSSAIHGNFSLRFRQVAADSANDEWLVDDTQITVIGKSLGGGRAGGRPPGTGGGGNSAPSVTIDSATHDADTGGNDRTHTIDVTFTGSDPDGDLSSYTVTVYDSSSQSYVVGSTTDNSYSGGQVTVSISDTDQGNDKGDEPYYVVVEVTDSAGQTSSDTATTTAR